MRFEDAGARVGFGIHRVSHAVDQPRAVARLAGQQLPQVRGDLLVVAAVLHGGLHPLEHLHNLDVRTAVARPLQTADGRGNGRVGIRPRRGEHTAGERGIVAAAMLGVQNQADVQQLRLLAGEAAVEAHRGKDVFGKRHPVDRRMKKQALVVVIALFHLIGVDHNRRNARNQFNGLPDDVFQRHILRQLVVAVQRQHAAGQLIHNIRRRRLDDHILDKALRQLAVLLQQAREAGKLLRRRQIAEQ